MAVQMNGEVPISAKPLCMCARSGHCPFECNGIITEIENKNEPITFSIEFTMMEADETFIVVIPIMKVEMRHSAVMSVERKRSG